MIHVGDRVKSTGRGSVKRGLGTAIEIRDHSCRGRHYAVVVEWDSDGSKTIWDMKDLRFVERGETAAEGCDRKHTRTKTCFVRVGR